MQWKSLDKYQVQSNFISNNSFEEIYGLEEDIGSLTPVKAKKVDETQFGIQKITTICEKKSEKDFNDLRMVQEFWAHTEAIWVATISPTNEYLATGGKDGDLNIWKINGADYIDDPFLLLDTRPFCTLNEQKDFDDDEKEWDSILDISWWPKDSNFILSAHLNRKVVLWDIQNPEKPVSIYEHADTVSWVTFHPDSNATKMKFMTGWLDKTYQIWSKDNSEPIYSQQARDYVTALSISPDGVRAVVGLYTGQLIVCAFDDDKLNYITSIECKNRMGKYSNGTKVTSIVFLDNTEVLVTTNDSRIRIVSVEGRLVGSGTKQMKFKGHKNDNLQIGASINDENDFIICGSEDGYAYIWDKRIEAEGDLDKERNDIYEKFNPYYPDFVIPTSTFFAPSNVVQTFIKKYVMCQVPRVLKNIIIVTGFNGVIRVFHNSHFVR